MEKMLAYWPADKRENHRETETEREILSIGLTAKTDFFISVEMAGTYWVLVVVGG